MAKKNGADNKFEWSIKIMKYWKQLIALMLVGGAVYFVLQIKTIQCGDVIIQKDPVKTPLKK